MSNERYSKSDILLPDRAGMLNLVTKCCKLLKVNQATERTVSSTVKSYVSLLLLTHKHYGKKTLRVYLGSWSRSAT